VITKVANVSVIKIEDIMPWGGRASRLARARPNQEGGTSRSLTNTDPGYRINSGVKANEAISTMSNCQDVSVVPEKQLGFVSSRIPKYLVHSESRIHYPSVYHFGISWKAPPSRSYTTSPPHPAPLGTTYLGVVHMQKLATVLLALIVVFAMVGCSSSEPDADTGEQPGITEPISPEAEMPVLTGAWEVTTVLTDIDIPAMTPAADQPGAQWTCTVDGGSMTLVTDQHTYTGSFESNDSGGTWVYDAASTYTDADGTAWTSTILVRATQDNADAFTGTMEGEISSDADGHLYSAVWDITGARQ